MLGDATWPEVLRRYLLFTRAGGRGAAAAAAVAAAGLPPARLDDRAAALVAAHRLAEQPHWRYAPIPRRVGPEPGVCADAGH